MIRLEIFVFAQAVTLTDRFPRRTKGTVEVFLVA